MMADPAGDVPASVEGRRAEVADAIARLNVISAERSGTLRVAADHDTEVTLARLSALLSQAAER